MGVLSTIISDLDVDNVLDRLVSYIQPGGYLILRDTLSTKKSQRLLERIPPAVYRSRFNYGSRLAKRGLVPAGCLKGSPGFPHTSVRVLSIKGGF